MKRKKLQTKTEISSGVTIVIRLLIKGFVIGIPKNDILEKSKDYRESMQMRELGEQVEIETQDNQIVLQEIAQ